MASYCEPPKERSFITFCSNKKKKKRDEKKLEKVNTRQHLANQKLRELRERNERNRHKGQAAVVVIGVTVAVRETKKSRKIV